MGMNVVSIFTRSGWTGTAVCEWKEEWGLYKGGLGVAHNPRS